ncbi:expressed unknown protein [Seminavis robusta]|uniref:Uncharacterized protein n=1 Tax=Seminavis robusta TaxID=568900 RepID=A0A9N8GZV2_9STRA|nr:expressed unknown protein [Seminavis robusta]|eukprot:Sro9_g007440.1 n/a (332) ;mRNA; f:145318-146313
MSNGKYNNGNSSSSNGDTFEPRRSTRIKKETTDGDGDIWAEKLVVCESSKSKLVIRSYFKNCRTGKRVWDEPPTGASRIQHASDSTRQHKEEELQNLQLAMNVNIHTNDTSSTWGDINTTTTNKTSKGFFPTFRKKTNSKNGNDNNDKADGPAKGGGGGIFQFGSKKKNKENAVNEPDLEGDEDMQRAISLSMGLAVANHKNKSHNKQNENHQTQEEIEMARAISMSLGTTSTSTNTPEEVNEMDEEEMIRRAIEASQRESYSNNPTLIPSFSPNDTNNTPTSATASLPTTHEQDADLLGLADIFNDTANIITPPMQLQQSITGKTTGLDE